MLGLTKSVAKASILTKHVGLRMCQLSHFGLTHIEGGKCTAAAVDLLQLHLLLEPYRHNTT